MFERTQKLLHNRELMVFFYPLSAWSLPPINAWFISHLVHSMVLHPQGGRCCFWLAFDSKRTESSRHATSVWGHLSPPRDKMMWWVGSYSWLGALLSVCVGHRSWKVDTVMWSVSSTSHLFDQNVLMYLSGMKSVLFACHIQILHFSFYREATWPSLKSMESWWAGVKLRIRGEGVRKQVNKKP